MTRDARVDLTQTDISITKKLDSPRVPFGGMASFTIEVTNNATEAAAALDNVVVSDPTAPGCSKNDIGTLQGGEKYRYVCSQANATADFINIVTVSATTKSPQETVTASAAVAVPIQPPIIINSGGVCQVEVSRRHERPDSV